MQKLKSLFHKGSDQDFFCLQISEFGPNFKRDAFKTLIKLLKWLLIITLVDYKLIN